ncbi:interferon alpha-inducible protein 27-like protein 2B isoform X2 [Clupea harengus]|uniref:Interferon alpha-inducible protein 27-like protein 2B isoform X2 n=1 Tax=Clupea harengus TaxID=7950 RepID=A0A6P8GPK4_CLUHA|nr:interferon alpha-inducible protein 27-like protein 2B isoform X2 [Clupea harengus]
MGLLTFALAALAVAGATGVVAEAPFMLTEDLTEEEIAAGYIPAKIMSSKHWAGRAAVANGRGVADGSVVAALESAGVVAEAPFMLTEDLTEEEIAAGYIPAKIMSSKHWAGRAAVANGRGVADGSVVAALESVGAVAGAPFVLTEGNLTAGEKAADTSSGFPSVPTLAAMAGGAVLAVVAVPVILSAAGFTAGGIAAGSVAAKMMASAAVANGGGVAAGGVVAVLQSAGAAGMASATSAAVGAVGAVVGGVTVASAT